MLIVTLSNGIEAEVRAIPHGNRLELKHPFSGAPFVAKFSDIRRVERDGVLQTWEHRFLKEWSFHTPKPTRYRTQVTAVTHRGARHDIYPSTAQADRVFIVGGFGAAIMLEDVDRLIVKEVLC